MTTVAVSGGYDPIHVGHIRSIREGKKLGDKLIVILTRDDQLIQKKGYYFMPYEERKEILENIEGVGQVVPNIDEGITSNESLEYYRPDIFAKGGDRSENNMPEIEKMVCAKIGCRIIYGVGGHKIQSSSSLVKRSSSMKSKVLTPAG